MRPKKKEFRPSIPAAALLLLLGACSNAPPVQEMSDARQAIQEAVVAGASEHAELPLADANRFMAEAEANLKRKAYNSAKNDAREAKKWAEVAMSMAKAAVEAQGDD